MTSRKRSSSASSTAATVGSLNNEIVADKTLKDGQFRQLCMLSGDAKPHDFFKASGEPSSRAHTLQCIKERTYTETVKRHTETAKRHMEAASILVGGAALGAAFKDLISKAYPVNETFLKHVQNALSVQNKPIKRPTTRAKTNSRALVALSAPSPHEPPPPSPPQVIDEVIDLDNRDNVKLDEPTASSAASSSTNSGARWGYAASRNRQQAWNPNPETELLPHRTRAVVQNAAPRPTSPRVIQRKRQLQNPHAASSSAGYLKQAEKFANENKKALIAVSAVAVLYAGFRLHRRNKNAKIMKILQANAVAAADGVSHHQRAYRGQLEDADPALHAIFSRGASINGLRKALLAHKKGWFRGRSITVEHLIRRDGNVRTSAGEIADAILANHSWWNVGENIGTKLANMFTRRKKVSSRRGQSRRCGRDGCGTGTARRSCNRARANKRGSRRA